ncbi:hypothetical protein PpBr36_04247 [Pyricularia pennisetigena]|uniref:hypothetical protein n=1 Tax=Pyricularia pennisetigena TaxID=1578925 RepID=UPI001153B8E7|nr:hypothetical protein PpBr36_04247 [Pyricularia pennisetigena]TLS26526.1 hypothetical protein PpBr36_04247 [Pyricularia pennisetigena]
MKTFVFLGFCFLFRNAIAAECYCYQKDGSKHNTATTEICESSYNLKSYPDTSFYCESNRDKHYWNQECKYHGCAGGTCK